MTNFFSSISTPVFIHVLLSECSWWLLVCWSWIIKSKTKATNSSWWCLYLHWCLLITHISILLLLFSSLLLLMILWHLSTSTSSYLTLSTCPSTCTRIPHTLRWHLPIVAIIGLFLIARLVRLDLVFIASLEVVISLTTTCASTARGLLVITIPTDTPLGITTYRLRLLDNEWSIPGALWILTEVFPPLT